MNNKLNQMIKEMMLHHNRYGHDSKFHKMKREIDNLREEINKGETLT